MAFFSTNDPKLWGRGTDLMGVVENLGGLEGIKIANFFMGRPEDDAPVATVLKMDPGHVLLRHGHNCWRLEVIVQGNIDVDGKSYGAGTIMFSEPGSLYGPHIAGPEGCTTVEIFSNFTASHSLVVEGPDGIEECDMRTKPGAERMMSILDQQVAARAQASAVGA